MERILHQLIDSLSHYLQGFIHTRWLALGFLNHQHYVEGMHMFKIIYIYIAFNMHLWTKSLVFPAHMHPKTNQLV